MNNAVHQISVKQINKTLFQSYLQKPVYCSNSQSGKAGTPLRDLCEPMAAAGQREGPIVGWHISNLSPLPHATDRKSYQEDVTGGGGGPQCNSEALSPFFKLAHLVEGGNIKAVRSVGLGKSDKGEGIGVELTEEHFWQLRMRGNSQMQGYQESR